MREWFVGIGYAGQLATWLVASFLLYILASQLAWQFQWYSPSDSIPPGESAEHRYQFSDRGARWVDRLRSYFLITWIDEILRFAYYLGIPFLAAINGLLPADLLGISGTNWVDDKNLQGFLWDSWVQGLVLAVVATLAAMGVWYAARLLSRKAELTMVTQGTPGLLWQRLLHAFHDQIHWAFYRSGPILWLNDLYWGTLAGLALVMLEAALNPGLWWALKNPRTAGPPLLRLIMAWVSALLFLATQNLWLTIGVHLVFAGLMDARPAENSFDTYESTE